MTEKERKQVASGVFLVLEDTLAKVSEINVKAAAKAKTIRESIDNEDMRINVRGAFKVMAFAAQIEGACRTLETIAPLVERLMCDGESDQFEDLLEMVRKTKCDAYRWAYEIERIFCRTFGK